MPSSCSIIKSLFSTKLWLSGAACATILNFCGLSMVLMTHQRLQSTVDDFPATPITFQYVNSFTRLHNIALPSDNGLLSEKKRHRRRRSRVVKRDYGGLDLVFPKRRTIRQESPPIISAKSPFVFQLGTSDDNCGELGTCLFRELNCNMFHELGLTTTNIERRYRANWKGKGRYREAFELQLPILRTRLRSNNTETVVWKKHLQEEGYDANGLYINMVRREAEVMSAVSASPNTLDIYGYCQVDVLVEAAGDGGKASTAAYRGSRERRRRIRQKKEDVENAWRVNDLTLRETVSYSLQAALGLRDLHASGYAHEDLKLSQFMIMPDNRLKLNDFNIARKLVMDPSTNTSIPYRSVAMPTYCYAPEYCYGLERDETFDVFVLGGIFYNFLTGQQVPKFWQENRSYTPEQYPLAEIRNSLHPAEQKFVKIMYGCWAIDRHDRSSAAYLVKRLDRLLKKLDKGRS